MKRLRISRMRWTRRRRIRQPSTTWVNWRLSWPNTEPSCWSHLSQEERVRVSRCRSSVTPEFVWLGSPVSGSRRCFRLWRILNLRLLLMSSQLWHAYLESSTTRMLRYSYWIYPESLRELLRVVVVVGRSSQWPRDVIWCWWCWKLTRLRIRDGNWPSSWRRWAWDWTRSNQMCRLVSPRAAVWRCPQPWSWPRSMKSWSKSSSRTTRCITLTYWFVRISPSMTWLMWLKVLYLSHTGNRKYVKCLYVFNKIDTISLEEVDEIAHRKDHVVISCHMRLNLDFLLEKIWEKLDLVRVYTKKRSCLPDFDDPIILAIDRNGLTVKSVCDQIHRDLVIFIILYSNLGAGVQVCCRLG